MGQAARGTHRAEFLAERFKNELDRVWSVSGRRAFVLPDCRARIVHVGLGKANPDRPDGIHHVIHHLAATQAASGLAVEVWGLTPDVDAPTPGRPHGLRLFPRPWNRFRVPDALRAAVGELDTTAVVHLHGAFIPALAAVARLLRKRSIPYVVTPHGAFAPEVMACHRLRKALWMALFQRRLLRGARAVQALSGRELMHTEARCELDRLRLIPNGQAPLSRVHPVPLEERDRRPVMAFCGRLSTYTEGLDALLEGFARHVADGGQGSLWIIGDGQDRVALAEIERGLPGGQLAQRGQNAAWMVATHFTWDRLAAPVSRELYGLDVTVPDVPDLPGESPQAHHDPEELGRAG